MYQFFITIFSLYKQAIDYEEVSIFVFNVEFVAEHHYININLLTKLKTLKQFRKLLLLSQKMCKSFKLVPWMGACIFMGQLFSYNIETVKPALQITVIHVFSCVQYKSITFPKFKECFSQTGDMMYKVQIQNSLKQCNKLISMCYVIQIQGLC